MSAVNKRAKAIVTLVLWLILIPVLMTIGTLVFREKHYAFTSLCVAVLSCVPLFYSFERRENTSRELTALAALVALSAAGRFLFAWLPGFKPVTAITILAAVYLGREAGFAVGSLSAVISNFYFGQGPWTPFQMFSWGMIGFLAGVMSAPLKRSRFLLCLFGALAGLFYSFTMDIWSTLWMEGSFTLSRYGSIVLTSAGMTAVYAVSNVLFLLLFSKPFGEKLERLKKKYGLFSYENP